MPVFTVALRGKTRTFIVTHSRLCSFHEVVRDGVYCRVHPVRGFFLCVSTDGIHTHIHARTFIVAILIMSLIRMVIGDGVCVALDRTYFAAHGVMQVGHRRILAHIGYRRDTWTRLTAAGWMWAAAQRVLLQGV